MKDPKPLVLALTLFAVSFCLLTNVSCKKDDPCAEKTWYKDTDMDDEGDAANTIEACKQPNGYVANSNDPDDTNDLITSDCEQLTYYADEDEDGYGNPNSSITQCSGVDTPTGYVMDNTDCDNSDSQIGGIGTVVYPDLDGDGFGDPNSPITVQSCEDFDGNVLDNTDCNDADDSIYPGALDYQFDGVDSDCGGETESTIIWNGPPVNFTKNPYADWTDPANQDRLSDNVVLTRQDKGPLYNREWWMETFQEDAIHVSSDNSDLNAEFWDSLEDAIKDDTGLINPQGGTKGVRWALLDDSGADNPNEAWDNFPLYGTLGDPTHFYSFHNLGSFIKYLNDGETVDGVVDNFTISTNSVEKTSTTLPNLVGKNLGVWIVAENIYLSLTFTTWDNGEDNPGGGVSYTRSSPNNP